MSDYVNIRSMKSKNDKMIIQKLSIYQLAKLKKYLSKLDLNVEIVENLVCFDEAPIEDLERLLFEIESIAEGLIGYLTDIEEGDENE